MNYFKRLLWSLIFVSVSALGATTSNSFISAQTPNNGKVQFTNADAINTVKTLYTAGANGSKCNSIWLTSTENGSSRTATVEISNGGVQYGGFTMGTSTSQPGYANSVSPVVGLQPATISGAPIDSNGNAYLYLAPGDTLKVTLGGTQVSAGKWFNVVVFCVDF